MRFSDIAWLVMSIYIYLDIHRLPVTPEGLFGFHFVTDWTIPFQQALMPCYRIARLSLQRYRAWIVVSSRLSLR